MEGAKLVKRAEPADIDSEYCVLQVVDVLKRTAKLCEQQNDTKGMMDVVAGWFELHERFVGAEELADKPSRFGFCGSEELEPAISDVEYEPFEDEQEEQEEEYE